MVLLYATFSTDLVFMRALLAALFPFVNDRCHLW